MNKAQILKKQWRRKIVYRPVWSKFCVFGEFVEILLKASQISCFPVFPLKICWLRLEIFVWSTNVFKFAKKVIKIIKSVYFCIDQILCTKMEGWLQRAILPLWSHVWAYRNPCLKYLKGHWTKITFIFLYRIWIKPVPKISADSANAFSFYEVFYEQHHPQSAS